MFGNVFIQKRFLLRRIDGVQKKKKKLEHNYSHHLVNLEKQLKDELDLIVCQEELICCQKSKVDWIQVGD